ncbi:hypothetical protein D3C79_848690 [compost metagenome]
MGSRYQISSIVSSMKEARIVQTKLQVNYGLAVTVLLRAIREIASKRITSLSLLMDKDGIEQGIMASM